MIAAGAWGRGVLAAVALLHVSTAAADGATQATVPPLPGWTLRLPQDAPVVYHGVANFDDAGMGTASFLYPAPGVAGLLVGIFAHGVAMDAAKQKQRERFQADADHILESYRPVLDKFVFRDLMQRALGKAKVGRDVRVIEATADAGQVTLVESAPLFRLTQDQRAIILDNLIAIQMPGVGPDAAYRNSIRIVSAPRNLDDPVSFWSADDGERIKDESARLVAESFDIAFNDMAEAGVAGKASYRTVRYLEGAIEKVERAQVLVEQCERLLIRTLRGNLMSVPVARTAVAGTSDNRCAAEISSR